MSISQSDLEFIRLREAKYDFIEPDEGQDVSELPPSRRALGRVSERAQIFTYQDLHNDSAALARDIEKAEIDLSPKVFKLKVQNLKDAMVNQLEAMKKQKELIDDEIKIVSDTLHIDEMDIEYNLALQKKLQQEEVAKEANNS